MNEELRKKCDRLREMINSLHKVAVAFSGGTDSALLLKVCVDTLEPANVLALTSSSSIHPASETKDALSLAQKMGARLILFDPEELEDATFLANTRDRCYYCKALLFRVMWAIAGEDGYECIVEGSNVDDLEDFRPGRRACLETGVKSPLLEAGFTKEDVRLLSREMGLATHDKPAQACLATRIPYSTVITREKLSMIEKSEECIKAYGIKQVRVRLDGNSGRIEVEEGDIPLILENRDMIADHLSRLGFMYVSLDLKGYRTGSMNE
ncbi:MAG: ATP-dependent sacrificial sulfur transferase LarE [Syntrophorhabdus sp.]